MPKFKGTIFVYNNGKQVEYYASNHGPSPGTLTHNMRKSEAEALNKARDAQHDDNGKFGHGNPVPQGQNGQPGVGVGPKFPIGSTYRTGTKTGEWGVGGRAWENWEQIPIQAGTWMRVGFRGRAFAVLSIPPAGEVVEVPYETMISQQGRSAMGAASQVVGWDTEPMVRDGSHIPGQLSAILAARDPRTVKGRARVVPVEDKDSPGTLSGWEVWFENTAKGKPKKDHSNGFIGTVVLLNDQGEGAKNAGLGLESMAVPGGTWKAKQFIRAGGDYGEKQFNVCGEPGTRVRLGIRGYSSHDGVRLPALADGPVDVDFASFTKTANATYQSDWFDGRALRPKLGEKKARIDFFRGSRRINSELKDTIYTGEEAFERAEFKNPPQVVVRRLRPSKANPEGGWKVTMTNHLPKRDKLGPVGFTGQLLVQVGEEARGDPNKLPPANLSAKNSEATWIIPADKRIAGVKAKDGRQIVIDTGALGWRATIELPAKGSVDTNRDLHQTWSLRESDYLRAGLYPE